MMPGGILVGDHVRQALANQCPVVALESTVITHGLPEPQNLELALRLEHEIRSGQWWSSACDGANPMAGQVVPATVGIVRGRPIVGLSEQELAYLARLAHSRPVKCSRRDLALVRALGLSAGTTVAGTLAIVRALGPMGARRNSLRVFATGGLGGVHLGGQDSMDVSADLYELGAPGDGRATRSLAVVSSGFKSFLDTRRSLELLESLGVTVASLGQGESLHQASREPSPSGRRGLDLERRRSHLFPGFFSAHNKQLVKSPWQCSDVREAAQVLAHCLGAVDWSSRREFAGESCGGSKSGPAATMDSGQQQRCMLLACPIPRAFDVAASEAHQYEAALGAISESIDQRLDLNGHEKTPLILAELSRRTGGATLRANLELLANNARVGAHLAYELARELGAGAGRPAACEAPGDRPSGE